MPTHVAFLRGMNLGRRRITNADLVAAVERLGFGGVAAYQASGNVLFDAAGEDDLEARFAAGLERELGYPVPTFVRSAAELTAVAAAVPFDADPATRGKLQVVFLAAAPGADGLATVEALTTSADLLAVIGRELYWWPQGPLSSSELDFRALEKVLGTTTTRTAGTVARIVRKLG